MPVVVVTVTMIVMAVVVMMAVIAMAMPAVVIMVIFDGTRLRQPNHGQNYGGGHVQYGGVVEEV